MKIGQSNRFVSPSFGLAPSFGKSWIRHPPLPPPPPNNLHVIIIRLLIIVLSLSYGQVRCCGRWSSGEAHRLLEYVPSIPFSPHDFVILGSVGVVVAVVADGV